MPERWLEVSIRATAEAAEAVSAIFEQAGHGGVVIEPEITQGTEEDDPMPAPGNFSLLRTYLPANAELTRRRGLIEERVGVLRAFDLAPMDELQFRWVKEEDWANAWKQHYQVLRLGKRWVIKPQWQDYQARPGERVIELDPGMAFGTGLHPTTQLILDNLEDLAEQGLVQGKTLLDLGTGSGVLAIGAARLGASSVLALDVDEVATSAARSNVAANGASERVRVRRATLGDAIKGVTLVDGIRPQAAYDGIMANIVTRVIVERAPSIAAALRPGGWLVASGVIQDREQEAVDGLRAAGLELAGRRQRGDWLALECRK